MEYSFAAERKVILTVQAGGRNRLVEFGERNEYGVSCFNTSDGAVANAIRKHSLARRGVIIETTPPQQPEPEAAPVVENSKPATGGETGNVRTYDNYTIAREAITKEFGILKSTVRTPTALDKVAREHGFTIRYSNAQA